MNCLVIDNKGNTVSATTNPDRESIHWYFDVDMTEPEKRIGINDYTSCLILGAYPIWSAWISGSFLPNIFVMPATARRDDSGNRLVYWRLSASSGCAR